MSDVLQLGQMKKLVKLFSAFVMVLGLMFFMVPSVAVYAEESDDKPAISDDAPSTDDKKCTSLLGIDCDDSSGDGIWEILRLILNIMTAGIGVLATVGIVITGIQWMTSRDNEATVVKAKSRLFNIVIGLAVWFLMWIVLSWLLPGGIVLDPGVTSSGDSSILTRNKGVV